MSLSRGLSYSVTQGATRGVQRGLGFTPVFLTGYIVVSDNTPDEGDTLTLTFVETSITGEFTASDLTPDEGDELTLEFVPVAYTYQWKKDGSNLSDGGDISGATTDELTITNVDPDDDGDYTVAVTDPTSGRVRTFGPETVTVLLANQLSNSEDLTDAVWVSTASRDFTPTANTTIAPDGEMTADTVTVLADAYWGVRLTLAATPYTFSIYVKKGTATNFGLYCYGSSYWAAAVFNCDLGTVVSGTGTITDVGNGWYRCSVSGTSDLAGTNDLYLTSSNDAAGEGYAYMWGGQLNDGLTVSTYRPT